MGRLERQLDPEKVAFVLAMGLTPHKRGRQPPIGTPVRPETNGKWPTPAYAEKLRRKREVRCQ